MPAVDARNARSSRTQKSYREPADEDEGLDDVVGREAETTGHAVGGLSYDYEHDRRIVPDEATLKRKAWAVNFRGRWGRAAVVPSLPSALARRAGRKCAISLLQIWAGPCLGS